MSSTRSRAFKVRLESEDGGKSVFIEVPFDVKAAFGKARAPVLVEIGAITFRSTVAVYGGKSFVPVRRDRREAAKVEAGQVVRVTLTLDEEPRTVTPPPELEHELAKNATLRTRWSELSYTNQREMKESIEGAKRADTKLRRLQRALDSLRGR